MIELPSENPNQNPNQNPPPVIKCRKLQTETRVSSPRKTMCKEV